MAVQQSTSANALRKPYPEYPLTPRKDGRWCKKIPGRLYYWTGTADEALKRYQHAVHYLQRGEVRSDPDAPDELTVRRLCNLFLEHKESLVESGELTRQTFNDYHRTARKLLISLATQRRWQHSSRAISLASARHCPQARIASYDLRIWYDDQPRAPIE